MALFVLGDPHLSLGASKPMDIFPGWNDYVDRLEKNWRKLITPQDTIVLERVCGHIVSVNSKLLEILQSTGEIDKCKGEDCLTDENRVDFY